MSRGNDLIDEGLGKISTGDEGFTILIGQQDVATNAVVSSRLSGGIGTERPGGRNEEPIERLIARTQVSQHLGKLSGLGPKGFGEIGTRRNGRPTLAHEKRSSTANNTAIEIAYT